MNARRKEVSEESQASIRMYRDRLAEIEESWKFTRAAAKQNLLECIVAEQISLARAAELSGHDRRTIKIWLDLWNAERKLAQQKK